MTAEISGFDYGAIGSIALDTVVYAAIAGGVVHVISKINNLSPLYPLVAAVAAAVKFLSKSILTKVAAEYDLPKYQVTLITAAISAVIGVAALVAIAALGLINPATIAVGVVLTLLFSLYDLGYVAGQYALHVDPTLAEQYPEFAKAFA